MTTDPVRAACVRWILRLLVALVARPGLYRRVRRIEPTTCAMAGLPAWDRDDPAWLRRLAARSRTVEASRRPPPFRSLAELGRGIGLDPVEQELLELAVAREGVPALEELFDALPPLVPSERAALLGACVGATAGQVRAALAPSGALRSSGLLVVGRPHRAVAWMAPLERLVLLAFDPPRGGAALERLYPPVPAPVVDLQDFEHLKVDLERLRRVLGGAVRDRVRGFDVLLHGPPGTGKTQIARWLAREVADVALEVPIEEDGADSLRHGARLNEWALCQKVASGTPGALVVFDEAEDAFPDANPFRGDRGVAKGWISRVLEEHPVPTIWVANRVSHLDPAYLRRFDVVLEVAVPGRAARTRWVSERLRGLPVRPSLRSVLVDDPRLTAAHLDRAVRAVTLMGSRDEDEVTGALEAFLEPQLSMIGPPPAQRREAGYALDVPRTDPGLERLVEGLVRTGRGTLLLHGPPGTGKTAFARHLAERCERPLLARTTSDLLGPLVGETERRLADAFRQARAERAILLLDEVDALLRTRARADRSWEVTQVNELLTQIDQFDGMLVCATNRLEDVDAAALRRFAVHVRFEPPDAEGRRRLLAHVASSFGLPPPSPDELERFAMIEGVTAGDLHRVRRELELLGACTVAELVDRLGRAHRPRRRLGFGGS